MSCLLDYSHYDRCEVYFIVVFTWISLVMTDVEACCGWAHHCWWAGRWGWPPPGYVTWWCMPVVDPLVGVVIMCMCSVVSDSLWPHGLYPTRLLCPWDFPGKNTGVGSHFLLPPRSFRDLPDPGIEHSSLASPVLAGGFFTTAPPGKPGCWWFLELIG